MAGTTKIPASSAELSERFVHEVEARAPSSLQLFEVARESLAAGVSSNSKTWCHLYLERAEGTRFFDIDGNEYLDLMMGYGPNLLGHAAPAIVRAAQAAVEGGTTLVVATPLEVTLAQMIQALMPSMERMRFVTTGTEATLVAMRVARAYTGRNRVGKFEGHYHGQHDNVLMSGSLGGATAGPAVAPWPVPDCGGIPPNVGENTLILPWGDLEGCESLIAQHANDLAAVICEPVPVLNIGAVPASREFIAGLRSATEKHGVLLIFDEVITGFRLALGGAAEYFGVKPDLHTLGKATGGGMPIGVYGGRADVMETVVTPKPNQEPQERAFQSGTFSGNRLSMATGIAMLEAIRDTDVIHTASGRAEELRNGLSQVAKALNANLYVSGVASIVSVAFDISEARTYRDFERRNREKDRLFSLGLLSRGIYWTPGHPAFLSGTHTEEDVDKCLGAAEEVLALISQVGPGEST
jgi:glutamate-1-semialdehyde 2,1-aminomutase